MKSKTAEARNRPLPALLLAALVLATGLSVWASDEAHACRPDMDAWETKCGTR